MREAIKTGSAGVIAAIISTAVGVVWNWEYAAVALVVCVVIYLSAHFWPFRGEEQPMSPVRPNNDDDQGQRNSVHAGGDIHAGRDINITQSSQQSERQEVRDLIRSLTQLSRDWRKLEEHPGRFVGVWFASDPYPSERELQHDRDRKEWSVLNRGFSDRALGLLEIHAPEFVAEWEASKEMEQEELLIKVIQELRKRL